MKAVNITTLLTFLDRPSYQSEQESISSMQNDTSKLIIGLYVKMGKNIRSSVLEYSKPTAH